MQYHRLFEPLLLGTTLTCLALPALANPIPSGINVSASISLDTANSSPASNASQSGDLALLGVLDGSASHTATHSTFNNLNIALNPLKGSLTNTPGDYIGYNINLAGAFNTGGNATNDGLFADLFLDFSNSSAIAYKAYFRVDMNYLGLQASGSDAFIQYDFSLADVTHNLTDIYYSREWRDTVNGNVSDSGGNTLLEVLLNPGDNVSFHGVQSAKGGAFADRSSSYSGSVNGGLYLVRFDPVGTQLPLPSTLWLVGMALGIFITHRANHA